VGPSEAEILYLSSALNTGSENVYEVLKKSGSFSELHPERNQKLNDE